MFCLVGFFLRQTTILQVLFVEMYVNVVFVMSSLYRQ